MDEFPALPVRTGHRIENNQVSGHARVHLGDQYNVTCHGRAAPSVHEKFLGSLWFNEIYERGRSIKRPAPTTLEWVFNPEVAPVCEGSQEQPKWDSFTDWASRESSTYWIRGKAGSGKSTLMLQLVRDKRTSDLLRQWSPDRTLHVLSFFFWRPGRKLQKKVVGMLRSLLYQVCKHEPSLIDRIIADLDQREIGNTVWTEESLGESVLKAMAYSLDSYCIFIDGLDEYTGPHHALVDLIGKIQGFDNVKCCVASRPEVELYSKLSTCKQLRLEKLNYTDISRYTKQKLLPLSKAPGLHRAPKRQMDKICDEVVRRASGVFLWVVLAIPQILKGASSGDDLGTLMRRLQSLPSEMIGIYTRMIKNIDPFHEKDLAFYINSMRLQSEYENESNDSAEVFPRITDIVAARLTAETCSSYATFEQLCDLEIVKIVNRSAGLLEVSIDKVSPGAVSRFQKVDEVWIPDLVEGHPVSGQLCIDPITAVKARRRRRRRIDQRVHAIGIDHGSSQISWVHRSAHEFVFPVDGSSSPLHHLLSNYDSDRQQLWQGALRFLAFGGSRNYSSQRSEHLTGRRIERLTRSTCIGMQRDHNGATQTLYTLRNVITELDAFEAYSGLTYSDSEHDGKASAPLYDRDEVPQIGSMVFWETLIHGEFWSVLIQLFCHLRSETAGNALFIPLLDRMLKKYRSSAAADFRQNMRSVLFLVKSLLLVIHSNLNMHVTSPEAIPETTLYWYGSAGDLMSQSTSHHGHLSVSSMAWSATSASQSVEQLKLAEAFVIWHRHLAGPIKRYPVTDATLEAEEVSKVFKKIMHTINAHFQLEIWRNDDCLPGTCKWYCQGILIHISCELALALEQYNMCLPDAIIKDLHVGLRIICLPTPVATWHRFMAEKPTYGQTRTFIWFHPSKDISIQMLSSFRELEKWPDHDTDCHVRLKRPALLLEWTDLLMGDVAMNQPQMSLVQQTLALACIRTYLPRLRADKWRGSRMRSLV